jgi:hypothetical protein
VSDINDQTKELGSFNNDFNVFVVVIGGCRCCLLRFVIIFKER